MIDLKHYILYKVMSLPFLTVRTCETQTDRDTVFIVQELDAPFVITVYDTEHAARCALDMLGGRALMREHYIHHTPLVTVHPTQWEKMKSTILPYAQP